MILYCVTMEAPVTQRRPTLMSAYVLSVSMAMCVKKVNKRSISELLLQVFLYARKCQYSVFTLDEVQPNDLRVFVFSYDGPMLEKLVHSLRK